MLLRVVYVYTRLEHPINKFCFFCLARFCCIDSSTHSVKFLEKISIIHVFGLRFDPRFVNRDTDMTCHDLNCYHHDLHGCLYKSKERKNRGIGQYNSSPSCSRFFIVHIPSKFRFRQCNCWLYYSSTTRQPLINRGSRNSPHLGQIIDSHFMLYK